MKKYAMYMHGGSENHGCEAIVRSTIEICKKRMQLYSRVPEMEKKYGVSELCEVKNRGLTTKRFSLDWTVKQIKKRFFMDKKAFIRDNYKKIIDEAEKGDVYFSIGGDNYCGALIPALQYTNQKLTDKGVFTILWGCSIDPEYLNDPHSKEDLSRYSLIFAREKVTYDALKGAGLTNVRHYPDPAFTLKLQAFSLPKLFNERSIVGINISPYVQKNGTNQLVYQNYDKLIEHIMQHTEYGVVLIPHVIWEESDDRIPSRKLYEKYRSTNRVVLLEDHNCQELKYCISKCKMLLTARTHASIAAYSTGVPTVVIGYSMKSKGLAIDLFGSEKNYVVNAWDMTSESVLIGSFQWLEENYTELKEELLKKMPEYIARAYAAANELTEYFRD